MRIHYHSDSPIFGGSEKMLATLWTHPAIRERHQLSFSFRASPAYTKGLLEHLRPDFPVYPLSLPAQTWPRQNPRWAPPLVSRGLRISFLGLTGIPAFAYDVVVLTRLLRRVRPDILHINNGGYPAARSARAAAIAAWLVGIPSVLMVVNNLAVGYARPSRWIDIPLDRFVTRVIHEFVTGSEAAAQRLKDVLGLANGRVRWIHNGIRLRPVTETPADFRRRRGIPDDFRGVVAGVVALMEPRKGHRVLLDALKLLRHTDPQLAEKLIVLLQGDGPLRAELESIVKRDDLGEVVRFVGAENNIANMMNALDVLVLPSIDFEDFPNVTLEAMGVGKAVIATRVAGIPEQIVDGETGYLAEPGNARSLADALSRLVMQRGLLQQFGENGRNRFQSLFTAELAVQRYAALYDSMAPSVT